MAIIKSGATTDQLSIGPTSKAAYVEAKDSRGNSTGLKQSYSASLAIKTATAAGTGVFASIYGSASTTIRVQKITVSCTVATAAVYGDIIVNKRTSVGTGGTATTLTQVPKDSTSPVGTATNVRFYTVLGTAGVSGAGGGPVASLMQLCPITATPVLVQPFIFDWTAQGMNEAPVLRGTNEGLELSFGATTTNVPTMTITIEWTEE